MKILYLTPFDPLDNGLGGALRSASLLSALRKVGDVCTIVVSNGERHEGKPSEGLDIRFVRSYQPTVVCRFRFLKKLFAFFSKRFFDGLYISEGSIRQHLGVGNTRFDVVVVRYPWLAGSTGVWKIAPMYVDVDDNPAEAFDASSECRILSIRYQIRKFEFVRWQYLICRLAHGLWVSNQKDVRLMSRFAPCLHFPNIAPGPDGLYDVASDPLKRLVVVGWMAYLPNRKGVDWFVKNIWPDVVACYPEMELCVIGRSLPEAYVKAWSSHAGVRVLGYVKDLAPYYKDALGVVTPLLSGGGTSLKLVEAAKYGCKIFSTSVASRGYSEQERASMHVDVFEDAESFRTLLGKWLAIDNRERIFIRKTILRFSDSMNSQGVVDRSVACMIHDR